MSCSLAAQGLWIKMLCWMAQSPRKGYLLTSAGNKMDSKTITKLCGEDAGVIDALIGELVAAGVPSVSEGIVYCRRMKKEADLTMNRVQAGRLGMEKRWHNKRRDKKNNKQITGSADSGITTLGLVTSSFDVESSFDSLWQQYPKKDGRIEALRHFRASVKTPEDFALIELALVNYKVLIEADRVERKFIKNGSTWFYGWRDWITPPVDIKPTAPRMFPCRVCGKESPNLSPVKGVGMCCYLDKGKQGEIAKLQGEGA